MPENFDSEKMASDAEDQNAQKMNPEKSSRSDAPFAAQNLPVPIRQSYVSRGFGTEAIAKVVQFAAELLKKCVKPIATERNRELTEAAARTAAKGFSDSFAGVVCALSDLKEVIDKKSPQSAAMLDQAGEKAKALGKKIKNAPAEVAPKLKELKESEKFEAAKEKIDKTAAVTAHVLSVGAEGAEKGLKKVAHDTGVLIGEIKDKTVTKIDEFCAEDDEDDLDIFDDTEEESLLDSETAPGIAKAALDKAGETLQSLNQFAGTGVSDDHEESEFSKKIDEHLNKFGTIVSEKTAELTKGPFGKAGEKIRSIKQQVGSRIPESLKAAELQKKLSENIKNFDAAVTKKNAEATIKKYAGAFSDKAKTLADSARQRTEGIRKSEAESIQIEPVKDEPAKDEMKPTPAPASRKIHVRPKFSASGAKFRAANPYVRKILNLRSPAPRKKTRTRDKIQHSSAKVARALRIAANWAKSQNRTN